MAASGKVKYAKLRLFKPSTSGACKPEVSQEHGESPKEPPAPLPEVIDLVDSEPEPDEMLIKRTRLDSREKSPDSPILRLPKLPRKPPEGGSGMISKFFKTSEDDFEPVKKETTAPKAKTKVQRKVTTRKPRAPRKSSQDIRKAFQKYQDNDELLLNELMVEHSRAEQVDPEQLQLAIAMSRSLSEQHGVAEDISDSQQPEVGSSASESTLQERRLQGIRTTLEQYGFKCKGNYADQDLNALFGTPPGPKTGRRGKTRRKTMLIRRTPEDIVAFMERGAERLLREDLHAVLKDPGESVHLDARTYGSDVFWMNENPNLGEGAIPEYFVEGLMEPYPAKAGCLLKDWHAIPGRERTPERKRIVPEVEPPAPPEVPDPNLSEVLQDPEDALLDMDTVPDEYREKYNNEVPLPVRVANHDELRLSIPETVNSKAEKEPEDDEAVVISEEVSETVEAEAEVIPEAVPLTEKETSDDDEVMVVSDEPPLPTTPCPVFAQPSASSPELFDSDEGEEEEGVFLTAPEEVVADDKVEEVLPSASVPPPPEEDALCTSSDNMFEDFDPADVSEPIVDCDMYSSDEVKMSTSSKRATFDPNPLESIAEKDDDAAVPHDDFAAVITLSSGDSNSVDRFVQLKRRSSREPSNDRGEKEPRLFPKPAKDLSFHALALQSRLSEVGKGDVETIEVEVEEEEGEDQSTGDEDEVLVISDEEVNYSIRRDYTLGYNASPELPQEDVPGEDPNATKQYFDLEGFNKRQSDAGSSFHKADNTLAFLDGLIEKFNLPPVPDVRRPSCDNKLDDFIEHYKVPDFSDEFASEQAVEEVAPEEPPAVTQPVISSDQLDSEIEKILNQAKQTCTQLEQESRQKDPKIHRTKSDSALLARPPKAPAPFQARFKAVLEEPAPAPVQCEIRLDNVTPRPDYDALSSPLLERELFKYGLKQLSRAKAVKMLNHIYDQLHPLVELVGDDETMEEELPRAVNTSSQVNEREELKKTKTPPVAVIGEGPALVERRDAFVPEIMDDEPYVLAVKPRKKTFWCSVPLHIAFYNMVKANSALRQRILRYEPLDLDAIVGHLKEIGLRYDSNVSLISV
uniref:Structure-specific endonuclease subunit SLX4 n=1 Tax=Culex pipiens TaxID=7175 RepID=A0A8D8L2E0_CULPI